MIKNLLTLDFETYWAADYTLSKMTNEAYVRDPRFHAHMVGLKVGGGKPVVVPARQIEAVFSKINWAETGVIAQNAAFDGFILSYHYGVHPGFWFDTMSMFRAIYPAESASLSNILRVLGLPEKGRGFNVTATKGFETLPPELYRDCATYCGYDCTDTWNVFNLLRGHFPPSELKLIDLTIRMFTEPILELNSEILKGAHQDELKRKEDLLARVSADKELLSSNPKFASLLLGFGIDPPKKLSMAKVKRGEISSETMGEPPVGLLSAEQSKEGWAYAFSKSDEEFKALLDSEDEEIRALVEARLGVKSTIKETRTQRLLGIASRGNLPVPLGYYKAHTGRYGGMDRINLQNLSRSCTICDGSGKINV
jgi:DNA polymerase